ncbi:MAG: hypothetical protein GX899_05630 [Rikenellaceae bacterium]|jgi:hypothetical protein|nr:hypothetical protein [Rikenellaceae bacterium]
MIRTIPYKISHIETVQFAIFPDNLVNGQDVLVNTNCGYNVSSDLNQVRNVISVNYTQNEKLLMVVQLACYYDIAPEGVEAIKSEGKIPVDFLRYMGSISIGTIRGVIHAKTEGTVLNPVVMPPVNLEEMIENDLVLSETNPVEQEQKK